MATWQSPTRGDVKTGGGSKPAAAGNPLLNPMQPLQGQSLQQAAQALTDAQTKGPLAELAAQKALQDRQSQAAQAKSAGYFNQLGNLANLGVSAEGGISNDLNAQLAKIGADTHDQINAIGLTAGANPALQSMSHAGLDGGAMSGLASEMARQEATASNNANTFRSFGATQGANSRSLAASNLGTFGLKGQEALQSIARAGQLANEPLNQKIADLNASKGALLASNEGKLRQQEINNTVTQQGLGIKQQGLALTAQNNAANQALSADRIKATLNGQNVSLSIAQANNRIAQLNSQLAAGRLSETQRHNLATERTALLNAVNRKTGSSTQYTPTGTKALTANEQQRLFGQVDTARSLIGQMQQPLNKAAAKSLGVSEGTKLTEAQIRHYLTVGPNPGGIRINPALVDAAYALKGYGFLTNKQVTELNKLGLVVGNRYKRGTPKQGVLGGSLFGVKV